MLTAQEAKERVGLAKEFGSVFCTKLDTISALIAQESGGGQTQCRVQSGKWNLCSSAELRQFDLYFERTEFQTQLNADATELTIYW